MTRRHGQWSAAAVTVLDPACGSGNFLYVSLQLLLGLEKEVITFATQLGFAFKPQVTVPQLQAIVEAQPLVLRSSGRRG